MIFQFVFPYPPTITSLSKPRYMNTGNHPANNALANMLNSENRLIPTVIGKSEVVAMRKELIRFEEKKERYIWALPDEICFVKSADHYVKSLIQCGNQKKWMTRHSTLKGLIDILPQDNFIRLNRFYLLNRNHFSNINESENLLYLNDDFSIHILHRISPYIRHLLKSTYT